MAFPFKHLSVAVPDQSPTSWQAAALPLSWGSSIVYHSTAQTMPPMSVHVWRELQMIADLLAGFKEGVHSPKWMYVLGINCNVQLKLVESDCFWTMTLVMGISREKLEVITAAIEGSKAWSINIKALASHELHVYSWLFFFNISPPHMVCLWHRRLPTGHKMTVGATRKPVTGAKHLETKASWYCNNIILLKMVWQTLQCVSVFALWRKSEGFYL